MGWRRLFLPKATGSPRPIPLIPRALVGVEEGRGWGRGWSRAWAHLLPLKTGGRGQFSPEFPAGKRLKFKQNLFSRRSEPTPPKFWVGGAPVSPRNAAGRRGKRHLVRRHPGQWTSETTSIPLYSTARAGRAGVPGVANGQPIHGCSSQRRPYLRSGSHPGGRRLDVSEVHRVPGDVLREVQERVAVGARGEVREERG